ncbi:NAD-dependent epimerase/dehydratase family protein [Jiella avicenniae]|uniref:NAD-dependent epimerase/dehydratase family protein n=1 Tax=Jiella avicenniae TaxID=2907202 RepID=A0A9X1P0N9_9HYPH|nr:NAD-dependent epimerase/dehydratase family protein [Jiella avicenniae]MCE7028373.1 NAD-dependent epimerase/dehydratase family protein [Jiella avicenniae]
MADERILLTGASGFIAKHVALQLLEAGYRVRGTVRTEEKGEALRQTLAANEADVSRLEIALADLMGEAGWDAAAAGCDRVCHMASPLPLRQPRDRQALVPAAKGGALRVVAAAAKAGARRLVMTSSVAAMSYGHGKKHSGVIGEADWSNTEAPDISPYAISKTEAEAAAWTAAKAAGLDMVSINPVLVVGPLLDDEPGASMQLVRLMMRGRMPAVPAISSGFVDVRDVAAAHVAALGADGAVGRRFLLSAGTLSLMEVGRAIGSAVPEYRPKLPRFVLPDFVVRLAALVVPDARSVAAELGRGKTLVCDPAKAVLGFSPRTPQDATAAAALSLREKGAVDDRGSRRID